MDFLRLLIIIRVTPCERLHDLVRNLWIFIFKFFRGHFSHFLKINSDVPRVG